MSSSKHSIEQLFSARGTRHRESTSNATLFDNVTSIRRVTAYNYIKYRDEYLTLQKKHYNDPEELKKIERKMLMILPLSKISSSGLSQTEMITIQRRAMRGYCMYGEEQYRDTVRLTADDDLLIRIKKAISERP